MNALQIRYSIMLQSCFFTGANTNMKNVEYTHGLVMRFRSGQLQVLFRTL